MIYKKTIRMKHKSLKEVNKLLNIESLEDLSEEEMQSLGAKQGDGYVLFAETFPDNTVVGCVLCSGSVNYWIDFQVVDSNNGQIAVFGPEFELSHSIELPMGENTYYIDIEEDDNDD